MGDDYLRPPVATAGEVQMLDQIDALTLIMAAALESGDVDTLNDALDESIALEKRLAESRETTWSVWFANVNRRHGDAA